MPLSGNGDENETVTGVDEDEMKLDPWKHDHHSENRSCSATVFGQEITNTASGVDPVILASSSSPKLFKRSFVDVEPEGVLDGDMGTDGLATVRTPSKKVKLNGLGSQFEIGSEDEVEEEVWGDLQSAPMKDKGVVFS